MKKDENSGKGLRKIGGTIASFMVSNCDEKMIKEKIGGNLTVQNILPRTEGKRGAVVDICMGQEEIASVRGLLNEIFSPRNVVWIS